MNSGLFAETHQQNITAQNSRHKVRLFRLMRFENYICPEKKNILS